MRAVSLLCLLLVAPAAGVGCRSSAAVAVPTGEGVWEGEGRQWNDGDRSRPPDETWDVRITLDGPLGAAARVDYPDLQCGGTLAYVGPNTDAGALAGDAVYREEITYGAERCATGGTVLLRPSRRTLIYAWAMDGRPTVAAARLRPARR